MTSPEKQQRLYVFDFEQMYMLDIYNSWRISMIIN